MAELVLRCGARVTVDDDVWEWAREHTWYLKAGYPCRYVRGTGYGRKDYREVYLHREIMGHPERLDVHHQDDNPFNAQRDNLRVLTRREHRAEHGRRKALQPPPHVAPE